MIVNLADALSLIHPAKKILMFEEAKEE